MPICGLWLTVLNAPVRVLFGPPSPNRFCFNNLKNTSPDKTGHRYNGGMKNLPYLTRTWGALATVLIATTVAGCASVADLDDAKLIDVRLATTGDLARYEQAREIRSRELFGGASFSDGNGHILASFSSTEFDQYLAYVHEHPLPKAGSEPPPEPKWPMLRLSFQSRRLLADPDASSMPEVLFYLCGPNDNKGRLRGFGMPEIMWHDRLVTSEGAQQIQKSLKVETRPQTYEIFFDYVYWDRGQSYQAGQPVALLPLPDDLCVALHKWNYPLPSSVGHPLRVSKDLINNAVGPLPRQISARDER
jgi:hypothetical protein